MSHWFGYFQSPSHQGWLIVYCHLPGDNYPDSSRLKYGDCFLWNPVSLKKIWLPSLHSWITGPDEGNVEGGVLSAPPTTNPTAFDNDNSMVFFLLSYLIRAPDDIYTGKHTILFCRPGDKQWRSETLPEQVIPESIAFFRGKLHILCDKNTQLVIEKQLGSSDDDELSLSITTMKFSGAQTCGVNREIKLLQSRDELFVIVIDYHHLTTELRYEDITSFQVFTMNFTLMVWEKVKTLGDHILFLGGKTTASCSAADLGFTRGHVYFTLPEDKTVYVFDLENSTISFDISFSGLTDQCFQAEWVAMPISHIKGNCSVNVEAEPNMKNTVQGNNDKTDYCKKKKKKKKNLGITKIVKSGTCWGNLDMDIIELIASYLHDKVDYLHFRAVCKTHRSVAPLVRKRTTLEISHNTTSLSPWLVLHQNNNDCGYRFINPMHNDETYLINVSEYLLDATIHCSKGGWLLMSKPCKRNLLFFFNPFTRDVIRLPELPGNSCVFEVTSFSSIPTSSDCTVFAIGRYYYSNRVDTYFISRGDDLWSRDYHKDTKEFTIEEEYLRFNMCRTNPVFHAGRFYCLGTRGNLGVFEIHSSEHSWKVLDNLAPACTCYRQSFLVECEGLLSVFVTPLNKMRPVQIFKLHASEKTKQLTWVEVEDLGKYMLFVSHTCCVAAVAPVSRMKNKIYFPRLHNNRIVFFSLDKCRYQTLFLSDSADQYASSNGFYSTKKRLYCTWIEPNWSGTTTTDAELVW